MCEDLKRDRVLLHNGTFRAYWLEPWAWSGFAPNPRSQPSRYTRRSASRI
jgi:hypothetical protein